MRILLTGASGFVGRHLQPLLQEEGHDVIALGRGIGARSTPVFVDGPQDMADIESWQDWPDGIAAIVHLAALNPLRGDASAGDQASLWRANVDATAAVARRAATEGVRRMIFASTAHVHAPRNDGSIRESDPLAPASLYARSKCEAEAAFWTALAGSHTEGCVLRPAPVYGAGARGGFGKLLALARRPLPLAIRGLGAPRSLVAVDQLCRSIALSLRHPAAAGSTFLVADDGPLTPSEIVGALRDGWGRRALILPAPVRAMAWGAAWSGRGARWKDLKTPFIVDTGHIQTRLGWQPQAGTAERLRQMAAIGLV